MVNEQTLGCLVALINRPERVVLITHKEPERAALLVKSPNVPRHEWDSDSLLAGALCLAIRIFDQVRRHLRACPRPASGKRGHNAAHFEALERIVPDQICRVRSDRDEVSSCGLEEPETCACSP